MWSTLYFLGPGKGYYVPVNRQGPYDPGVARRALEEMIAGPLSSILLRSIPSGMALNDVRVEGGTLYADFDHSFEELGAGEEEKIAVALAMTEFSTVQQVQFLVNGSPSGGVYGRPRYVNFDNPDDLAPEESVALTLYFATPDGQYLFPLVRRVPTTVATARTTIEEMIAGPGAGYQAVSPLPADLEILNIYREGSTIVVDFNAVFNNANQSLAINALALSMAGLTADSPQGVDSIRILVDGSLLGTYYPPLLNAE
jgi:spore germination protein GerM